MGSGQSCKTSEEFSLAIQESLTKFNSFKRDIKRIPGFTAASMTSWEVTKLIEIQNEKTRIENDAVQIVRSIESLLEKAVKAKIPSLKFQAEIWTSPFDTVRVVRARSARISLFSFTYSEDSLVSLYRIPRSH